MTFFLRRKRRFHQGSGEATTAATRELPQRRQNFRFGALPSPHCPQMRSPGSIVREGAVDMEDYSVWDSGRSVEQIWTRYFETIGEAARSGLFDVVAHPDLVKMWGAERPLPEGDLDYRFAIAAMVDAGDNGYLAIEGARDMGPDGTTQAVLSGVALETI